MASTQNSGARRATSAERALDPQPESLGSASNGFEDQSIELGWIAELMGCSEQRLWLGWRQGKRGTARLVQLPPRRVCLPADQYRPPDFFDTSTPRIPSTSYHPNRARPRGRVRPPAETTSCKWCHRPAFPSRPASGPGSDRSSRPAPPRRRRSSPPRSRRSGDRASRRPSTRRWMRTESQRT